MKGGGQRRLLCPKPNGHKDRDEDLLLFREIHKREKERIASLLQPVSDEFEPNSGRHNHSGFSIWYLCLPSFCLTPPESLNYRKLSPL